MLVKLLKSKIHRAKVTETRLHYPGSLAVDSKLLDAAGLLPYESVTVADIDSGNRLETYLVPAEPGSKKIIVLGAAAHLIKKNDTVIVLSFGFYSPDEAETHKPKIIILDENNDIIRQT